MDRLFSITFLMLTAQVLSGCLLDATESFDTVPLTSGTTATYRVDGLLGNMITGAFGPTKPLNGSPVVPYSNETVRITASGPHDVIGPDGTVWDGITRLRYDLILPEQEVLLLDDFLEGHQSIATTEWVYRGDYPDGEHVPTHNYARGTPDVLLVLPLAGQAVAEGDLDIALGGPPWSNFRERIGTSIPVHIRVNEESMVVAMQGDDISSAVDATFTVTYDRQCPFPLAAQLVKADGGVALDAKRSSCHAGDGAVLEGGATPASRVQQASPSIRSSPAIDRFEATVPIGDLHQAEAWEAVEPEMRSRCGGDCTIVGFDYRIEKQEDDGMLPTLPPGDGPEEVPVWTFAGQNGQQLHFVEARRQGGELAVDEGDRFDAVVGTGGTAYTLDLGGGMCALAYGEPDWRLTSRTVRLGVGIEEGNGLGAPLAVYGPPGGGAAAFSMAWRSGGYGFLAAFNGELPPLGVDRC